MKRSFSPFEGVLAAAAVLFLSVISFAQSGPNASTRLSNSLESELMRAVLADDDAEATTPLPTRPRVVTKAGDVRASVVVNTMAVERTAFDMLNKTRMENGVAPLVWNDKLAGAARTHSRNMADFKFFSHRGLDDKLVSDRADDEHLGRWRSIGENIAWNRGYDDPIVKAVEQWLKSPDHKKNLLDPNWRETAVGVAVAEDGAFYFTQVFLRK